MTPLRCILFAICMSGLAGCSLRMTGVEVEKDRIVNSRPEGTIGPTGSEGEGPWQAFTVEFPATLMRVLVSLDSTFHLLVTDCRNPDSTISENSPINTNGVVSIEDIYVDGATLNGSHTGHSKLRQAKGPVVQGIAYLSTSWIRNADDLCFRVVGGSLAGASFKSNIVRIHG